MTNAKGFFNNEQEEKTRVWLDELEEKSRGVWRTVNTDFPYDNQECMNTVTGRALYRLFVENLFVSAISFDGGENAITYPYADDNYEIFYDNELMSSEPPDLVAFDQVGRAMSSAAGGDIIMYQQTEIIKSYPVNDTITLIGTNFGAFEDWAYAAGWDDTDGMVSESCTPTSAPDLPDDFFIANFTDNSTDPDTDAAIMDVKTAIFSIYTGDLDPLTTLYGG